MRRLLGVGACALVLAACVEPPPPVPPVQVGVVEWLTDFTVAGVADNGTVIGDRVGPDLAEGSRAAIWRSGAAAPEDLSTADWSTGIAISPGAQYSVLLEGDGPLDPQAVLVGPGGERRALPDVVPFGVTDLGYVAGATSSGDPAVVDPSGTVEPLPLPPGYSSGWATAISNGGWVTAVLYPDGAAPVLTARYRLGQPGLATVEGFAADGVGDDGVVALGTGRWYTDGRTEALLGFPGDGSFWAGAVSRLGDVAGTSAPPGAPVGAFRPVVWPAGSIEPLALGPTACWLTVRAVSASWAVGGGVPGSATTSCSPPTGAASWRVRIR